MTTEQITNWFRLHELTAEQRVAFGMLLERAKELALAIDALLPESADKSAAMRKLRESVMTVRDGLAYESPARNLEPECNCKLECSYDLITSDGYCRQCGYAIPAGGR